MASEQVKTEFTGDSKGLVEAYHRAREAERESMEQRRQAAREAREAHREEQENLRLGKQMTREVMTEQERYREKIQQIERAYESGAIDQETYNRQLAQQEQQFNKTSGATEAATSAVKGFIAGFVGLAGIKKMLEAVRAEMQNIREMQKDAADTQLSAAEAERDALKNFGPDRGADLSAMARRVQKSSGAAYATVLNTISEAASKLGTGLDDEDLEDAVTVAARLSPGNAEAIRTGASAIITQKKVTGGTAAEIAGQQMQAKRLSPVASDAAFATNIAPGAANLVKLGLTPQQAFGLMAAGGSAVDDAQGAMTANAMLNMMIQLKTKAPQFDNPFDALAFVRSEQGAGLRKELLGPLEAGIAEAGGAVGLTGEKKFLPFMASLLQADPTAAQESLRRSVRGIPTLDAAGRQFQMDLDAINATELQRTADIQRRLDAATENRQLVNVAGGRASIAREGLQEYLKAAGVSAVGQKFAAARFEAMTGMGEAGALEFLEDEFSGRASELRQTRHFAAGMASSTAVAPSEKQLGEAKAFEELAAELRRIRGAIEHQTSRQDEHRETPPDIIEAPAAALSR